MMMMMMVVVVLRYRDEVSEDDERYEAEDVSV